VSPPWDWETGLGRVSFTSNLKKLSRGVSPPLDPETPAGFQWLRCQRMRVIAVLFAVPEFVVGADVEDAPLVAESSKRRWVPRCGGIAGAWGKSFHVAI
jgi:hypothetical protein